MQLARPKTWLAVTLVMMSALVIRAIADDNSSKANTPSDAKTPADKKPATSDKAPAKKPVVVDAAKYDAEPIAPKREAAAIKFAQQHHSELAELLSRLKASHPEQDRKSVV